MKTTTFADPLVKQSIDRLIPVKIDVDQQKLVAEQFSIDSMPTFLILSQNGDIVSRRSGFMESDRMVNWLER